MSCLTANIERKGGILASAVRVGGIDVVLSRYGGIEAYATRVGGVGVSFENKGGVKVNMGLVCGANLGDLEVLWVQDGPLVTIDNGYLITE